MSQGAEPAHTSNSARVLVWMRGAYESPEFVACLPRDEGHSGVAEACEGVGPTQSAAILDLETQLEAL